MGLIGTVILLEIANEVGQQFGRAKEDFAPKMARRIKRKFKTNVSIDGITAVANHFSQIYGFCKSRLSEFVLPVPGGFASLDHIKLDNYLAVIYAQYPDDDKAVLDAIANWVIQYEYLR